MHTVFVRSRETTSEQAGHVSVLINTLHYAVVEISVADGGSCSGVFTLSQAL